MSKRFNAEKKLNKKLPNASRNKKQESYIVELQPVDKIFSMTTQDGRLTFAGAYFALRQEVFQSRKLNAESTRKYDGIMLKSVLPYFGGAALEDLDEKEIVNRWGEIIDHSTSDWALRCASVMIRGTMALAFSRGWTKTILWGLAPVRKESGVSVNLPAHDDDEKEGEALAKKLLRNKKTYSLAAEMKFLKACLDHMDVNGEALGALIMAMTGTRTSETTGFSFRDLTRVCSGYYALVRYMVSEPGSDNIHAGGKSINAYRMIPLPAFLADILLARREMLRERYKGTEVNVDELPLFGKGVDHKRRCKQSELNEFVKNMFWLAGVEQDILLNAYQEMQENMREREDCEGFATAYLLRHQFATSISCCNLTPSELAILMGHRIEEAGVVKADYAMPSVFRSLADRLDCRPCVYILNRELNASRKKESVYDIQPGMQQMVFSDGNSEFHVPANATATIFVQSNGIGDKLVLVPSDPDSVMEIREAWIPVDEPPRTLSCYQVLVRCAQEEWSRVQKETMRELPYMGQIDAEAILREAKTAQAVIIDPAVEAAYVACAGEEQGEFAEIGDMAENEEGLIPMLVPEDFDVQELTSADSRDKAAEMAEPVSGVVEEPSVDVVEVLGDAVAIADEGDVAVEVPEEGTDSSEEVPQQIRPAGKLGRFVMVIVDDQKKVHCIGLPTQTQHRNGRGEKILAGVRPLHIMIYDSKADARLLAREGIMYRISKGTQLDDPQFLATPTGRALVDGAILLQGAVLSAEDGFIMCVANTGHVRRVALVSLQRFPREGRCVVKLEPGEYIADACLGDEKDDLLILSGRGNILRLDRNRLRSVNAGAGLTRGMSLDSGDQPTACIPYRSGDPHLIVTEKGNAVLYDARKVHMAHGASSQGSRMVSLEEDDRAIALLHPGNALYIANSAGYGLCCKMQEISARKSSGTCGVIVQREKAGQCTITALPLDIDVDA